VKSVFNDIREKCGNNYTITVFEVYSQKYKVLIFKKCRYLFFFTCMSMLLDINFFSFKELVELIKYDIESERKPDEEIHLLEVGCGSGAISLSLIHELNNVNISFSSATS